MNKETLFLAFTVIRDYDSDIEQSHFQSNITLSSLQGVQINIIFQMRKKSIKFPKFMDDIF